MLFALDPVGIGGIDVREPEFVAFCDAVAIDDAGRFLQVFPMFHCSGSVVQTERPELRVGIRFEQSASVPLPRIATGPPTRIVERACRLM